MLERVIAAWVEWLKGWEEVRAVAAVWAAVRAAPRLILASWRRIRRGRLLVEGGVGGWGGRRLEARREAWERALEAATAML